MTKTKKKKTFGYKVFNSDWICRKFQFKVGETYQIEGELKICDNGFHYCNKLIDCFNYYNFDSNNKVALVEILGDIQTENDKSCTNKIKIVREISRNEVLNLVNIGKNNTGRGNLGDKNLGDYNLGDYNFGYRNSGDYNSGDYNLGHRNSGYRNSGDYNSGDYNSGDYNLGHYNSGFFNTNDNDNRYKLFDLDSEVSYSDFINSSYYDILSRLDNNIWVNSNDMTNEEKDQNPHHEVVGGYLKVFSYKEMWSNWWSELNENEKDIIKTIPNFDDDKFYKITGIRV